MLHQFSRTELLIGAEGIKKLAKSKVAVFGVGGVGSFTAEALARAGVGKLVLIDYDEICLTNVNRQLHALHSTIGRAKVEVMRERILDINPNAEVEAVRAFYTPENREKLVHDNLDFIVDAIDTVTAKIDLIVYALEKRIPIVSSMGAGNRLDPTSFVVADISETRTCPLAKVVRKELRKRGIEKGVTVVYSPQPALTPKRLEVSCKDYCICPGGDGNCTKRRAIPGSISFVPAVAGLILAGVVVNQLLAKEQSLLS